MNYVAIVLIYGAKDADGGPVCRPESSTHPKFWPPHADAEVCPIKPSPFYMC
jgi:hypothetical protein